MRSIEFQQAESEFAEVSRRYFRARYGRGSARLCAKLLAEKQSAAARLCEIGAADLARRAEYAKINAGEVLPCGKH